MNYRLYRWVGIALMTFGAPLFLNAKDETANRTAWELMAGFSSGQAMINLAEQSSSSPGRQLALATALLGKYPQTSQNVDRSEEVLRLLLATSDDPEIRAAAYYLLARIEHLFREDREARAADYYEQLRSEYPESRLADIAAVKLALLYLDALPWGSAPEQFQATIKQLALPNRADLRSHFHQVVASYLLEQQDLESAFVHLQAARNLGVATGKNRANLQVQVGRVGALLQEHEAALEAYEAFVNEYPSDGRNYMVRQEIMKLQQEVQP